MPMLIFLTYMGEVEEGGEEEEQRVRRPWIGGQGIVTTTGTTGETSRGTDHCPPGGRCNDEDVDGGRNRLQLIGVTATMH